MRDPCLYDYAIVRVLPRVEREEFVNAGVILSCPEHDFLEARIALDEQRLLSLDPAVDLDTVRKHLTAISTVCAGGPDAGPIGALSRRQRFHWLVATRSTMIQPSPVHAGYCSDPNVAIEHILNTMVRPATESSG